MSNWERLVERCNSFVWGHMYPGELIHPYQHRDIVRTFFAGIFEALILLGNKELGLELEPYYQEIAQADWLPGPEFQVKPHQSN